MLEEMMNDETISDAVKEEQLVSAIRFCSIEIAAINANIFIEHTRAMAVAMAADRNGNGTEDWINHLEWSKAQYEKVEEQIAELLKCKNLWYTFVHNQQEEK